MRANHRARPAAPAVAAVLVGLLVVTGAAGCQAGTGPGQAADQDVVEVTAVVDGGTLEVLEDGTPTTLRLRGVAAPAGEECLSAEAASALAELVPVGAEVRVEREDDGDAAVYAKDVLVNAELVRRGLAFVTTDETGPVTDEVREAEQEAIETGAGVFGAEVDCTLPAQVAALEQSGAVTADAAAAVGVGVGIEEIDRHGAALATVATTAAALAALLDSPSQRYPSSLADALKDRTAAVNERVVTATAGVQQVRAAEEQRIEAERVAAEAAAQAAAEEAARAAQAAAEAEAARAAAAAQEAARPAPAVTGGSVSYANCDAVRAAGAAPILAGQPGYSSKLDRDGDGVGCEN